MKRQTKPIRRAVAAYAIANGCGFEQNEPNDQGQVEPNVYIQGFSPTYRPVIKNDYRIAIMNSYGRESNYMVFKDMATLEKKIAIAGIDVGMLARLRQ